MTRKMFSLSFSMRAAVKCFFACYLVAGIFMFRDIGLSWDEDLNRIGTALPEFNFIFHGDKARMLESSEKYHGPSLELLLLSAERLTGVKDSRQIYLLRHFITFFFFWLSAICMFLLTRKIFRNDKIGLVCVCIYVLSPRLFGESFYNSKDIGFLSFFTVSLYSLQRFLANKNYTNALILAGAAGFTIDIRITGILIPGAAILIMAIDNFLDRSKKPFAKGLKLLAFFIAVQFVTIVFFWPVLWLNPFLHLKQAFAQMSGYPWRGPMLFMGSLIMSDQLPWYYLPVWIAISIPFMYSILFAGGAVALCVNFIRYKINFYQENRFLIICFGLVIVPVAIIIVLSAVVYDGWRHIYFIYAPFTIVAGYGVQKLYLKYDHARGKNALNGILIAEFLFMAINIFTDHPHEHVYFNLPARMLYHPVTQNFDCDYWGLSYRAGLEYILKQDTSSQIHIRVESDPGLYNLALIKPEDRARIIFHGDLHESDYWLAEFRGKKVNPDTVNAKIIHQITNSAGSLLTVYKGMRKETTQEILWKENLDFENEKKGSKISGEYASEGNFSRRLGDGDNYSETMVFPLDSVSPQQIYELNISANVLSLTHNPDVVIVFSVYRGDSSVFWCAEDFQNRINGAGIWTNLQWNVNIPKDFKAGDEGRVFLWNITGNILFADDFNFSMIRYTPK